MSCPERLDIHKSYIVSAILVTLLAACTTGPKDDKQGQGTATHTPAADFAVLPTPYRTEASVSALVRFVDIDEGGTVYADTNAATGFPTASLLVESSDSHLPLGLEADGLLVAIDTNQHDATPYQVKFEWTPWHGNGNYVLNLQLLDWDNSSIPSSQVITVNVTGIPENAPTVKSKFIELYRERFGLNLVAPIFARFNASTYSPDKESRWVSTAYIGNHLYEIDILDNGTITTPSYVINSDESVGFCRPSGTIRMLAVVVDYGNTGLDPMDVEAALLAGLEEAQQQWANTSLQIGLSEPVLQVELTTFVYGPPPLTGRYVTPDEIRSAGGLDPADFDLLVEIDLDKNNTITGQYEGMGVSLGDGCRLLGIRRTNIAFNVRDQKSLENAMPGSIFHHELIHSMGWMHWWPNQSGDSLSWVNSRKGWEPSLLFGWRDVDGDGVIEILDPTPYGLIQ
ncbi:MAG: hypothetical protein JNM55_21545 [Anaerolineales bacterium]|nr:hypothetical protein [Anaerolineales bacterium]